ncbi:hypothetical protein HDU78_009483 [Chytriomyces hyalinus]|nr:hypothetical protein HDU78_009483 [Chytriomyces hyalinus]
MNFSTDGAKRQRLLSSDSVTGIDRNSAMHRQIQERVGLNPAISAADTTTPVGLPPIYGGARSHSIPGITMNYRVPDPAGHPGPIYRPDPRPVKCDPSSSTGPGVSTVISTVSPQPPQSSVSVSSSSGVPAQDRKKQTQACGAQIHSLSVSAAQKKSKKRGPKRGYKEELMERMANIEALVRTGGDLAGNSPPPVAASQQQGFDTPHLHPGPNQNSNSAMDRMDVLVKEVSNRVAGGLNSTLVDPSAAMSSAFFGGPLPLSMNQSKSNPVQMNKANLLGGPDFDFDFGESLYSFQSIIGQSFLPSVNWDSSDSLSNFLDELTTPSLPSAIARPSPSGSDPVHSLLTSPKVNPNSMTVTGGSGLGVSTGVNSSSSSSSGGTPKSNTPSLSCAYVLTELDEHLVMLYFAFLSTKIFMFHEPAFFANLYPQNKHPSFLIYSICAMACLFSDHKGIAEFGTTRNCCADYASRAVKEMNHDVISDIDNDSIEAVQSLLLLAVIEYSFNQPVKAYRKMVTAIQMSIRLKLDQEDPNVAMNPLSIWPEKTQFYSPEKLMVRRKVWEFCMYFDTCIGLAGGLPLVIYEAAYMYLLSPPKCQEVEARLEAMDQSKLDAGEKAKLKKVKDLLAREKAKTDEGLRHFKHCLANPPTETVFEALNMHVKVRPQEIYDKYHLVMNQLSFILHRVIRLNYTVRTAGKPPSNAFFPGQSIHSNPGLSIVQSIIPPPQDAISIHDALIDFYSVLPPEYKPFLSLAQFYPIHPSNDHEDDHPVFAPEYDPTPIHTISIVTNFLSALVTLHLPRTDDTRPAFKIDSGLDGYKKVTSAQVVFLARKGMVFLVRGLLPRMTQGMVTFEQQQPPNPVNHDEVGRAGVSRSSEIPNNNDDEVRNASVSVHSLTENEDVEPTFATKVDQAVHSINVNGPEASVDELARRSRMPLASLVLEEPMGTTSQLKHDAEPLGVNISALCDPIVGFHLFTIAVSAIAVTLSGSQTGDISGVNREILTNLEKSIESVDFPVIDCITYIFPVCASFSERLKRILQVVKKRLRK